MTIGFIRRRRLYSVKSIFISKFVHIWGCLFEFIRSFFQRRFLRRRQVQSSGQQYKYGLGYTSHGRKQLPNCLLMLTSVLVYNWSGDKALTQKNRKLRQLSHHPQLYKTVSRRDEWLWYTKGFFKIDVELLPTEYAHVVDDGVESCLVCPPSWSEINNFDSRD